MSSRADMDRPASVTAALIGVALIAITLPYFLSGGPGGGTTYDITWSQATAGESSAPSGAANQDVVVTVTVADRVPSNASVLFAPCTDGAQPPLTQPATITWSVREGDRELDSGTTTCNADPGPFVVPLDGQPDVGSIEADSASDAEQAAYGDANRTATYTLTFRWSRPAGATGPLPLPPPAGPLLTGTLEVQEWRATANTPDQEVPR
jgi:hypothetical protein